MMPDSPLAVARSVCRARGPLTQRKLNISGASESFVAWLLADLPHLIGGGIVGSMPLSRTQQDLFQAAGVQESRRTHTRARLTSAQRSAAAVSGAERLSSRHVLPRDLSNALKQLDDGELDRLFAATCHELQRRGRSLTNTSIIRPTPHMGTQSSVRRINQQQRKNRPNGSSHKNPMSR